MGSFVLLVLYHVIKSLSQFFEKANCKNTKKYLTNRDVVEKMCGKVKNQYTHTSVSNSIPNSHSIFS
jgi:hypothetical protein